MFYQEKYRIQSLVCDASDHLSLWGLSRLFQEVAEYHTFATGIGYNSLIQHQQAWVLCRMFYEVNQMPALWDNVLLTTWSRGTNGLFAIRDFQMEDEASHQILASATAYWAVIDFNTRHVTRLHDIMANYEHHDQLATSCNELHKLRSPIQSHNSEQFTVQQFVALQSMLDHTHHVNNAEYLKWISNHQPLASYIPFHSYHFQIDYVQETRLDDVISILQYPQISSNKFERNLIQNEDFYFQIRNPRGVAANIEFHFD